MYTITFRLSYTNNARIPHTTTGDCFVRPRVQIQGQADSVQGQAGSVHGQEDSVHGEEDQRSLVIM